MTLALAAVVAADTPAVKPAPPKIGPLSYFEDRCSRCHGPQGSFYGQSFGKKLTDEALREVVESMCRNQGDAPLKGADLDAQVAYHRALIANEPFLAVTRISAMELAGEVTEKAAVSVRFKRATVAATVKGVSWKVTTPKGERAEDAVVTATLEKRSSVLNAGRAYFSHGKPLPDPETKPSPSAQ